MRRTLIAVAALVLTSGVASAADVYGTAGCGLGSMAFGDKKGFIQVLAATTNGTFGTQTFGITSGTSNCDETRAGKGSAKIFIEGNREALAKDAARGNGETIDTLSQLAGCKDAKAVGTALQKSFSQLFPGETTPAEQVSQNVMGALRSDASLACSTIG